MVTAVMQGIGRLDNMLQDQAILLNGIVCYCERLDEGQNMLIEGQSILLRGQEILLQEVLKLHADLDSGTSKLLMVSHAPPCRMLLPAQPCTPMHPFLNQLCASYCIVCWSLAALATFIAKNGS